MPLNLWTRVCMGGCYELRALLIQDVSLVLMKQSFRLLFILHQRETTCLSSINLSSIITALKLVKEDMIFFLLLVYEL